MSGVAQSDPVKLYSIEEVAAHLKVHPKTVEIRIRRGELGSMSIGRRVMIRADQLQAFIDAHTVDAVD
jgi:excisionase family DNA binding protein